MAENRERAVVLKLVGCETGEGPRYGELGDGDQGARRAPSWGAAQGDAEECGDSRRRKTGKVRRFQKGTA